MRLHRVNAVYHAILVEQSLPHSGLQRVPLRLLEPHATEEFIDLRLYLKFQLGHGHLVPMFPPDTRPMTDPLNCRAERRQVAVVEALQRIVMLQLIEHRRREIESQFNGISLLA